MSEVGGLGNETTAVDEGLSNENNPGEPTVEAVDFDPTPYGDHMVALKVDGQEVKMKLSEALAGSMRQADYTQKTQDIAAVREQAGFAASLKAALASDPDGTIRWLAEQAGVNLGGEVDPEEYVDPQETRLAALERQIAAQDNEKKVAQVQAEIDLLEQKYDDFDKNELLPICAERGLTLEEAYRLKHWDSIQAKRAASDVSAQEAQDEAARTEAKRSASAVVSPGHNPRASGEAPRAMSMEDAFKAAKRQLNLD